MKVHEALTEVEEDRWQCLTCSDAREENGDYCMSCRMYWEDCRNGLWEDRYEPIRSDESL